MPNDTNWFGAQTNEKIQTIYRCEKCKVQCKHANNLFSETRPLHLLDILVQHRGQRERESGSSVSSSASKEETNETAEKTTKAPAVKRQKIKEYSNAWKTDFPGHGHEDDVDTEKWRLSVSSSCIPCCPKVQTWVVNIKHILKRGRSG